MDNKRIRILHVAQAAGGVDRYIRMLFKYMDHDRFENILVCARDFIREDYNGLADAFEYVDMRRSIGKSDIAVMRAVRKIIKKYKPDIVYAHSSKVSAIARIANIGLGHPCIYNPHGWAFNMENDKAGMYEKIERIATPFCGKIICILEFEKQSALEKRIRSEDKLHVIVNGVDIKGYEHRKADGLSVVNRNVYSIPVNAFVVGMAGRISMQKAPDVFVKAAKLIKEKIPEAFFIIVGDGPDREKMERYAVENGLKESLLIMGWVENSLDNIDLFDVALLLSRWEGFELALLEYILTGKPAIASCVDAIPEIIRDGENGLLVDADNESQALESVLRIHTDTNLRLRLRNNGMITVHDRFNAKRNAMENEEIITSVIFGDSICSIFLHFNTLQSDIYQQDTLQSKFGNDFIYTHCA